MTSSDTDKLFVGSIPEIYERFLVPLIFEPYAVDLAARVSSKAPSRVLELAAGTGVLTRAMASTLPEGVSIVATDLNQPMLDHARAIGTARAVEWRQADAMKLPFDDGAFDAVVCQFGVMFFPDKAKAYAEARRVLAAGGTFLFNAWDAIEHNEFADTVTHALVTLFPEDPPRFLARTPHGYHDKAVIDRDLALGGFTAAREIQTVTERSRASSFSNPAIALEIGSDVWVGGGAIILPGVTIGSKAVIGAGSVVTRDVPEGVFAAGNPCRVIRDITSEQP